MRWLTADSSVDITPVSYANYQHQEGLLFDLVKNPVVADAQAVKLLLAFDLFYSRGVRIVRQRINPLRYPSPH